MALPKQRTSTQRKGKRRSGIKKASVSPIVLCSNCKGPKKPHTICVNCGQYKDRNYEEKKRSAPQEKTKNS